MTSCTTATFTAVKPFIAPVVGTLALKLIDKSPSNLYKIKEISEDLRVAAKALDKSLTQQDFRTIVTKTSSSNDFVLLSDSLYGFYQQHVTTTTNVSDRSAIIFTITDGLDQAVQLRTPAK